MKLALIGGGGVRTPLVVASTLRRAERIGLEEICLMDVDVEKVRIFGALSRDVAAAFDSPVRVTCTADAREALAGARYAITSIRVGGERGRVLDERIALRHGVLGQETTGAGGFAMALRSVPAILDYARLLEEVSPGAWIVNFTNPAGLVTQALHDRGCSRVIGICDSANGAQNAVASWLGVDARRLRADVFGLNHLSWARRVLLDGEDVLAPLLRDPAFCSNTLLRLFEPGLIGLFGMWLNEYLFYYYHTDRALEAAGAGERTRGEEILEWNEALLDRLGSLDVERDAQAARAAYDAYMHRRIETYMSYGGASASTSGVTDVEADEGYAGVALDVIESLETGKALHTALIVPNQGAIACLRPDDVVEVSCLVDREGVHPQPIGAIPELQEVLVRTVKLYEKLTVEAIHSRSRATAVAALLVHPLVRCHSRAEQLVDEYLATHAEYLGDWA
jgi:6-phospho-beta-glucosidase